MSNKNQNKSKKYVDKSQKNMPSTGLCVEKPDIFKSGFTEMQLPLNAIIPFTNLDGQKFQEMIDLNNTYAALDKQIKQYDAAINRQRILKKQIQSGERPLPIIIHLTQTVSYAEADKTRALKYFDDVIKDIELAKNGLVGTYERRRDEFAGSLIRMHRLIGEKVKSCEIKKVSGIRPSDKQTEKDEQEILEKELDSMVKSEKGKNE